MTERRVGTSVTLPKSVLDALKKKAASELRHVSNEIEIAVRKHLGLKAPKA